MLPGWECELDYLQDVQFVRIGHLVLHTLPKKDVEGAPIVGHLPEWIHLDVVGRLTPSKDENQEFTTPDLHTQTWTPKRGHPNLKTQT
jgi:hypothetical protein